MRFAGSRAVTSRPKRSPDFSSCAIRSPAPPPAKSSAISWKYPDHKATGEPQNEPQRRKDRNATHQNKVRIEFTFAPFAPLRFNPLHPHHRLPHRPHPHLPTHPAGASDQRPPPSPPPHPPCPPPTP